MTQLKTLFVILIVAVAGLPPATAGAQQEVQRIPDGSVAPGDVIASAIALCQEVRPDPGSAVRVLLSRDDDFADALAGTPLANFDSCILFTEGGPGATLDSRVRGEIDRVLGDTGEVNILGGTQAVSQAVEDELEGAGHFVQRFAGASRYETAVEIARVAQAFLSKGTFFEAIVAYGNDWPDALTAGAYAAATGTPVVLTPTNSLHPATRDFLEGGPQLDRTFVIGGSAVISDPVAQSVPNPQRVFGGNRMGTAAAVASVMWPDVPASGQGSTGQAHVFTNLEADRGWTLALAAAPLSALRSAPQLGVRTDSVPQETQAFLDGRGGSSNAVLLGDETFISSQGEQAIRAAVGGGTPPSGAAPCDPAASTTAGDIPNGAERVEQVQADIDGDGQADQITTYGVNTGEEEIFTLHVRTANGFATDTRLTRASGLANVRPLGTATIGEGRPVAFVVENVGASTVNVTLFGLHENLDDPCSLGRVTIPDPTVPPEFPIYSGNGLQCRDVQGAPALAIRQVEQTDQAGEEHEWTEDVVRWPGGGALQFVSTDSGTFRSPEDDEQIQAFSTLDCPGVEAP